MLRRFFLLCSSLFSTHLGALEIELRYEYDTSGFFDQVGSREAMRACADFFEELITDELSEINAGTSGNEANTWAARPLNPSTGARLNLVDLVVPENTLIIYPGARDLSGGSAGLAATGFSVNGFQPFFDQVTMRGQSGAGDSPASDFGPWGGSIAFDTRLSSGSPRVWSFSLTGQVPGTTNFVGVALHEICHLLGIGASESWSDQSNDQFFFEGPASLAANDGTRPKVTGDKGHWATQAPGPYRSDAFGSFGTPHGLEQQALMNTEIVSSEGNLSVITDLDLASLIDIGWQVQIPASGSITVAGGQATFRIPTNTAFSYRVQQGDLIAPFSDLGPTIAGDGTVKTVVSPTAPNPKNFYRFVASRNLAAPAPDALRLRQDAPGMVLQSHEWAWSSKGCCAH